MDVDWGQLAQTAGTAAGYLAVLALCLGGLVLSALSLSGTWLVVAACALACWLSGPEFPGWITLVAFILVSLVIEAAETFAAALGIQRRGGTRWAGIGAVAGGLAGLLAGAWIPVPFVGPLLGLLIGSFWAAYAIEKRRLGCERTAAHIARGAVLARIAILLVKIVATLAMIVILLAGVAVA